MMNDDCAKWILEPLVICPLDPTAFLRKEFLDVCFEVFEKILKRMRDFSSKVQFYWRKMSILFQMKMVFGKHDL